MNSINKLISLLLLALLLVGCAGKQVEIDHDVYKAAPVSNITYQVLSEPISITPSGAGTTGGAAAGGLIGALVGGAIDAGINSSRRKALAPILATLGSFDHNQYVIDAISEKATGDAFSNDLVVTKLTGPSKSKALLQPSLVITSFISPNLEDLDITLTNQVYQASEDKRPYVSVYTSSQTAISNDIESSKEANQAYWVDNAEELIAILKQGFDEVIQQFVEDLNGGNVDSIVSEE